MKLKLILNTLKKPTFMGLKFLKHLRHKLKNEQYLNK